MDILKERHPVIASNQALRDKVNAVRADGTAAIDRFSHDVDLTILLRYAFHIIFSLKKVNCAHVQFLRVTGIFSIRKLY